MAYTASEVSDIEVEKEAFLKPSNDKGAWLLEFNDELRIEYLKNRVDDPDRIMGLKDYKYQTSWLSLISASVQFSKNGTVKNPDLLEKKGVWRYTPVCKMLPTDYLPEN
ncbi:MAG: hypothetical protein WD361_06870 [Gracilimonas sp.]